MTGGLVFLCGFPSSGTDLLKNIMNSHPDVCINGEFPFLYQLAGTYGATLAAEATQEVIAALQRIDVYHNLTNLKPEFPRDQAEYRFADIYAAMLTKEPHRWQGNKTPQNTEHIDALHVLFPEAKFIVITRDVRDVALSWSKKWGKHKVLCAHRWNTRMLRGAQCLKQLDEDDFLLIKYESILSDFENIAYKICDFLQIRFDESMNEFHKSVHQILDGKVNYGRALIKDNAGKWMTRLSAKRVRRIEEVAFQALCLFDYPITQATEPHPLNKWEKFIGYAWDVCALALVGNRAIKGNRLLDRWTTIVFEIQKLCSHILHRAPANRPLSGRGS